MIQSHLIYYVQKKTHTHKINIVHKSKYHNKHKKINFINDW